METQKSDVGGRVAASQRPNTLVLFLVMTASLLVGAYFIPPLGLVSLEDGEAEFGNLTPETASAPEEAFFEIRVNQGNLANLMEVDRATGTYRIDIIRRLTENVFDVQAVTSVGAGMRGERFTIEFEARADNPRTFIVAATMQKPPWTNLGLYKEVAVSDVWSPVRLEFCCDKSTSNVGIFFNLGSSSSAVELRNFHASRSVLAHAP